MYFRNRRLLAVILNVGLLLTGSQQACALDIDPGTSFKDIDKLTDDLAQQFYRAWQQRLAELPKNFQQIGLSGGAQFQAPNHTGCQNTNSDPRLQRVAEILHSFNLSTPGELTESINYRGCDDEWILKERSTVYGENLKPMTFAEVIAGKRRFVPATGEPQPPVPAAIQCPANPGRADEPKEKQRIFMIVDPVQGTVLSVNSKRINRGSETEFTVLGKRLVHFLTQDLGAAGRETTIEVKDFDISFHRGNSNIHSRASDFAMKFTIVKKADVLKYRIDAEPEYTDLNRFQQLFSERVAFAVDDTASFIMGMYLESLPQTKIPKPSVGANQRILDELNRALSNVTNKTQLESVIALLQSYITDIQSGDLEVNDHRKKP